MLKKSTAKKKKVAQYEFLKLFMLYNFFRPGFRRNFWDILNTVCKSVRNNAGICYCMISSFQYERSFHVQIFQQLPTNFRLGLRIERRKR